MSRLLAIAWAMRVNSALAQGGLIGPGNYAHHVPHAGRWAVRVVVRDQDCYHTLRTWRQVRAFLQSAPVTTVASQTDVWV